MSGRVGVEQTPNIEAAIAEVLRLHPGLTDPDFMDMRRCRGLFCGWSTLDRHAFDALFAEHVAQALAPVLAAAVREARAAELREAADRHERELVCCDVFERLHDKPTTSWTKKDRAEYRHHSICYWGAACAEGDRDRADRIDVDAPEDCRSRAFATEFLPGVWIDHLHQCHDHDTGEHRCACGAQWETSEADAAVDAPEGGACACGSLDLSATSTERHDRGLHGADRCIGALPWTTPEGGEGR